MKERIQNCDTSCNHKSYTWQLISRFHSGFEIWYHKKSRTIWADRSANYHKVDYFTARNICYDLDLLTFVLRDREVIWRLPSARDFKTAYKSGMDRCTLRSESTVWVRKSHRSSLFSVFYGARKTFHPSDPYYQNYFRCILKL